MNEINRLMQEVYAAANELADHADLPQEDRTITYDQIWHPQKGLVKVYRLKENA